MAEETEQIAFGIEALQETVLAGLLSVRSEREAFDSRMGLVQVQVLPEFMEGKLHQLWTLISRYYPLTGGIPSPESLAEILEGTKKLTMEQKASLLSDYERLCLVSVSEVEFRLAVVRIRERWRDEQYSSLLSNAVRIHSSQMTVGREVLSGFEDSVEHFTGKLTELQALDYHDEDMEGDVNTEAAKILEDYIKTKEGEGLGIKTGFTELDGITRGMYPGEVWIIGGFTGEGKSKLVYNMAWEACYNRGKNVLFLTNEATRTQVRRNIVSRHAHHPKFGSPRGLKYSDIKYGTLSREDEETLKKVLMDMKVGEDHGHMFISQLPLYATTTTVGDFIKRHDRIAKIDAVFIDYLGLLGSTLRRGERRDEIDDALISIKKVAVDFQVPVVTPWQINRQGWLQAVERGYYIKTALSDSNQAERTSDVILTLLKPDDAPDQLKCQVLKNRDGEAGIEFSLFTDFSTSYVSSRSESADLLE